MIGSMSRSGRLVESIIHFRTMFPGSTTLDDLLDDSLKCTNAHTTLPMSSQGIMPGKGIATRTWVRFAAGVNLGMALEIVASDEAFLAMVATELSVTQMSLNMRLDVLFSAESLVAVFVLANPFVVSRVWPFNELCDVIEGDVCLFN